MTGPARSRWLLWALLLGGALTAVTVKTLDLLLCWQVPWLRQVFVIAVLAALLAFAIGRKSALVYLRLCGLLPASAPVGGTWTEGRLGRLVLGAVAVVGPGAALVLPKGSGIPASVVAVGLGIVCFFWLVGWEVRRWRAHRRDPANVPAPARDVLWTIALPWVALTATSIVAIWLEEPSTWSDGRGARLGELVVLTAFGEELIFRGLLLALALAATRGSRPAGRRDREGPGDRTSLGYWTVSFAFGLWHVGDAILDGRDWGWSFGATVGLVVGTVLLMTLASRVVLIPLRLRTGTLAAPVLVHVAANAPGIVFGGEAWGASCVCAVPDPPI